MKTVGHPKVLDNVNRPSTPLSPIYYMCFSRYLSSVDLYTRDRPVDKELI